MSPFCSFGRLPFSFYSRRILGCKKAQSGKGDWLLFPASDLVEEKNKQPWKKATEKIAEVWLKVKQKSRSATAHQAGQPSRANV
jgi:hypothetical protein